MTMFNDIFNRLLPNNPAHAILELTDRLKTQHFLGMMCLALGTLGLQAHVGQAGIGDINQLQVSNHSLVPQHTVIRQPQMLFLVLDQQLNGPTLEIVGNDSFHRRVEVIRNQRDMFTLAFPPREDYFDRTQFAQVADTLSQAIGLAFTQTGDGTPPAAVVQHVAAVLIQSALNAAHGKLAIGLAHADIVPFSRLAGFDHHRAQIEGVKQHRYLELFRQRGLADRFGCQFSQLAERHFQLASVFFLDVQPRAPRNGNAAIIQAHLDDGVAVAILARSMMVQLAHRSHLLGPLERLGVVDDEKQVTILLGVKPLEGMQGDLLDYQGPIPDATPEKLAVVGAVRRATQRLGQSPDRGAVADGEGQDQAPEMAPGGLAKVLTKGAKKDLCFLGDFADSNHVASPAITSCIQNSYRQSRPLLFRAFHSHKSPNRSV